MLSAALTFSPLAPLLVAALVHADPVPPSAELRMLAGDLGFLEGPVWVPSREALVFSDIPAAKLMQWTEADGLSEFTAADYPNGAVLDEEGRILSCEQGSRSVVRRDPNSGQLVDVLVTQFEGKRFNSPNDLALHSSGTIWFTDPPWGLPMQREGRELPGNYVFRWDPETRAAHAVLKQFAMPNGIVLSPRESLLYVSDTGGHRSHPLVKLRDSPPIVAAFALKDGRIADAQPVWSIERVSDGMCVDARGRLYLTGKPGVTILGPDGERIGEVAVTGPTTNVCFGGADYTTLFITSANSLYAIDLEAVGLRPN